MTTPIALKRIDGRLCAVSATETITAHLDGAAAMIPACHNCGNCSRCC